MTSSGLASFKDDQAAWLLPANLKQGNFTIEREVAFMTPQMVTVEVDQNTALAIQRLKEKAFAQGVTVDSLISPLFENGSSLKEERPLYETASPQELAQAYLDWVNSHDRKAPGLTLEDVSRESIYEDRW